MDVGLEQNPGYAGVARVGFGGKLDLMLRLVREHWIATLILAAIAVGGYFNWQDTQQVSKLRAENAALLVKNVAAQCGRGNVVRAYLIVDAGRNAKNPEGRQAAAAAAFPILNCTTGTLGPPPELPESGQQEYLDDFEAKYPVSN
jgi:hypothetical protein